MRTVIAPLDAEVASQLAALAPPLRAIARRFIARLALEPLLGHRLTRGRLATDGCRAVYFDRDSRPDDLFGPPRTGSGAATRMQAPGHGGESSTAPGRHEAPACC